MIRMLPKRKYPLTRFAGGNVGLFPERITRKNKFRAILSRQKTNLVSADPTRATLLAAVARVTRPKHPLDQCSCACH
jgi:hypothetical protein